MLTVTLKQARANLNRLVAAALRGEQVVLMRGARHVVTLLPISAADLELAPRLSDAQAERLWAELSAARRAGQVAEFAGPEPAVAFLRGSPARPAVRSGARRKRPAA